jgi:arylsulfatase A-like enzyme
VKSVKCKVASSTLHFTLFSCPRSRHSSLNVLLISIDTLRADRLGCYGYPRLTSPNLTPDTPFLTECTWMRKRAVRTTEWKLILALEPDIHGRPPVELYHLGDDPGGQHNLADVRPEVVEGLSGELFAWIARREAETGNLDPIAE